MLLLAILIALFAERLAPQLAERRSLVWFDRYAGALTGRLNLPGWLALTVLVAPWALLVVALQSILHGVLWGALELAFSVLVLFLALRPGSVDPAVDGYVAAREQGDEPQARHYAEHLLGGSAPESVEEEVRAVADTLLLEANERWVAPIFWFVLLGPVGALVYRLIVHLQQQGHEGAGVSARLLRAVLEWLPARILAAMYILSGSFEEGMDAWRPSSGDGSREPKASLALELEQQNRDLLLRVGRAALRFDAYDVTSAITETGSIEADASIVRAARGLVLRSIIVIVAIIALLTLGDWID
jgi:membrane protein required for beta-lactamase induction